MECAANRLTPVFSSLVTPAGDCVGCLGSQSCWVCLGTGELEEASRRVKPCHRCYGTGICAECRVITLIDIDRVAAHRERET